MKKLFQAGVLVLPLLASQMSYAATPDFPPEVESAIAKNVQWMTLMKCGAAGNLDERTIRVHSSMYSFLLALHSMMGSALNLSVPGMKDSLLARMDNTGCDANGVLQLSLKQSAQ